MLVSFGALALHFMAIGFTTTIIKILVTCATPLLALGLRNTVGGILLILSSLVFSSKRTNLLKYIPKRTILGATFRVLIPSAIGYWAMQYVSAAKFAFFYNLCPFVTYILSYLLLGELMTRRKLLGMSIAFAGTIPILMTRASKVEQELTHFFSISLPEVGIVIVILSLCYGCILMRQLVIDKEQYSILAITGYDSLLGGGTALIFAYILPCHQEMYKLPEFILWGSIMTVVAGLFVRPIYAVSARRCWRFGHFQFHLPQHFLAGSILEKVSALYSMFQLRWFLPAA